MALDHDPTGLSCESNVLRYRPLPGLTVRVAPDAAPFDVARVLVAVAAVGAAAVVSLHPDAAGAVEPATVRLLPRSTSVVETAADLAARVAGLPSARVRLVGSEPELGRLEPAVHVDARPPVLLGRVELLRYLREQTVSRTLHRFGNVVRPIDDPALRSRSCRPTSRCWATTPGGAPCPEERADHARAPPRAQASATAVTSFCRVSLASPKSMVVLGS